MSIKLSVSGFSVVGQSGETHKTQKQDESREGNGTLKTANE